LWLWLLPWLFAPALWATPTLPFDVVERYPHRSGAFTQGLDLVDDTLYESSGLYGKSWVARWRLDSDEPIDKHAIERRFFAEGLTVLGDRLYLLTWQSGIGLVLDARTLQREGSFRYRGEGWGLTHDGRRLILSDGTDRLRFFDPQSRQETGALDVTEAGRPLRQLNELEWIDADATHTAPRILANVWQTDRIVVIDPDNGFVTAQIDLSRLHPRRSPGEDVLNGIAWDARDGTLLVTGKRWRYLWRLRLREPLP
jgi:glutaminyl-peptide cyclotransferase